MVDTDEDQIRNNEYAQETILGDVQSYRFAPGSFDLVICYNVIEHLPDVEAALLRLLRVAEAGRADPDRRAQSRTRYPASSPNIRRTGSTSGSTGYVQGDKQAGLPGQAPFPTHYHPLVTPSKLEAFARANGLQMIYRREYESPRYPEMRLRQPRLAALIDAAARVMNLLLPGKVDVRHGDYHVILRKI